MQDVCTTRVSSICSYFFVSPLMRAICSKPLAFYTVSFGSEVNSTSLRQMAIVAREVYASAPRDALIAARGNPCSYTNAIDTVCFVNFRSQNVVTETSVASDPTC